MIEMESKKLRKCVDLVKTRADITEVSPKLALWDHPEKSNSKNKFQNSLFHANPIYFTLYWSPDVKT